MQMPTKQHNLEPDEEVARLMREAVPAMAVFVKEARASLQMSQMELAHLLGITQSTVSGWETSRMVPDFATLAALSAVSKVPLPSHGEAAPIFPADRFGSAALRSLSTLLNQAQEVLPATVLRNLGAPTATARGIADFILALDELIQVYQARATAAA